MVVAALLAVAGSFYASGHARPPSTASAASTVRVARAAPPIQAKLTRCVVWPQAIGGVLVPAKAKLAFRVGPKPLQVAHVLVPVEVIVPDHPGPANVAGSLKTGHVMCVLAASGRDRKALILPSP